VAGRDGQGLRVKARVRGVWGGVTTPHEAAEWPRGGSPRRHRLDSAPSAALVHGAVGLVGVRVGNPEPYDVKPPINGPLIPSLTPSLWMATVWGATGSFTHVYRINSPT